MNSILKKYKIYDSDEKTTHTTLIPPAKYNISRKDIDNLFDNIEKHTLTELPQYYSQLRFDFDIMRETPEEIFYTKDMIHNIIKIIQNQVKLQTIDFKNRLNTVCFFEKPIYKKNIKWSGGFHLQFPFLFLETKLIWSSIIEPIIDEVFLKTGGLEFDNIYTKPWYIYGCCKSLDHEPYTLSKIFDYNGSEMNDFSILETAEIYNQHEKLLNVNLQLHIPRIFSINPFGRDVNDIKEIKKEIIIVEKKVYEKNDNIDINELKTLIEMIPSHHMDDFNDWRALGQVLWNISTGDDEYLQIWDKKSKESDKYEDGCCDEQWSRMKESTSTIGTIKYWIKQDSVQKASTIIKQD